MSEVVNYGIPKNWKNPKIGDFAYTASGGTPKRSTIGHYDGNIPWVKSGDLNNSALFAASEYITQLGLEKSSAKLFKPGTVLIALYGATIGRLSILQFEAATNQAVCGITLPDSVDSKYLFYYLLNIRKKLVKQGKGGAQPNISQGIVKNIKVPIAPPEQQKRIVAKIEKLFSHIDAGIAALNQAKQLLKRYRQSILKAAVTGELTKQWRKENKDKLEPASQLLKRILAERREKWEQQQLQKFKAKGKIPKNDKWKEKYKEPTSLSDWSFLCKLPKIWVWSSVSEIGNSNDQSVLTGPFGSNLGKKDFANSGVPVLTIGCLKEAGVDLTKAMHVSEEKANELERYRLKDGDMLFSRMASVGRAGHVGNELEGFLFNYHIMRLRLHPEAILQDYFTHYVSGSRQVYEYVKEVNHGATRDGINTQQLLAMPIALPPPAEQAEICRIVKEKLHSIRRTKASIETQLKKVKKTKKSILSLAFSGNIH